MPPHHARAGSPRVRAPGTIAAGVLLLAAAAAAWWPLALVLVGVSAFLLGRWGAPHRVLVSGMVVGTAARGLAWAVTGGQPLVQLAGVVALVMVVLVADGLGRLTLARTRYREQGWQLAEALRGREQAAAEAARTAERSRIAGEMHDSLGHDMALLAMQLAALQVQVRQGDLPAGDLVARLAALRVEAAAATERLHEVIGLLEPPDRAAATAPDQVGRLGDGAGDRRWSASVEGLVQRAREAGLSVELTGGGSRLDRCSTVVGATVVRVVEEALTNAAKHAPGAPLRLGIEVEEHAVRVRASNPRERTAQGVGDPEIDTPGSGRGLSLLTERTRALGGSCRVSEGPGDFEVSAEIPTRPVAAAERVGDPIDLAALRRRNRHTVTRRWQSVVVLPAAVLTVTAVVLVLAFVAVTLASVLPRERFAAIEVGQPQGVAEALLPPVQMPDAPQTVAEVSADCRYYEERVSFFERVTTFQVCFAGGAVLSATEIPAGRSR